MGGTCDLKGDLAKIMKLYLPPQIFKPKEAFMMLSKELLDIVKKQSFEIFVDSVGVSLGSYKAFILIMEWSNAFDDGKHVFLSALVGDL